MQQRGRYKAARVIVEERLKSGEAIQPEELADLLEMTVPEVAAREKRNHKDGSKVLTMRGAR